MLRRGLPMVSLKYFVYIGFVAYLTIVYHIIVNLRWISSFKEEVHYLAPEPERLRYLAYRGKNNFRRNAGRLFSDEFSTVSTVDKAIYYNLKPSEKHISGRHDGKITEYSVQRMSLSSVIRKQSRHLVTLAQNYPGMDGRPVVVNASLLSEDEKRRYDQGWKRNSFSQFVSDMIPLNRRLPDYRDTECTAIDYGQHLPDTSVVICFRNEAWSTLLRTVHSVLDRSPPHLLREIILVDDFSEFDHLGQPLETYISNLEKVKLLRTTERVGLIKARLLGYSAAQGDVLTFLDAHCECTQGWLEPLLSRIAANKTNVVCPVISIIDTTDFRFTKIGAKDGSMGVFHWDGFFQWERIPDAEHARRNYLYHLPYRSPVMAGGLFSISRDYFTELGSYDDGMVVWGGENVEISFRIWMCGGTLEIVPCSLVGHVFRVKNPNLSPIVNAHKRNTIRLAEVWMDDYKKYYYETFNYTDLTDHGDLSERKALRERLHCQDFGWYLQNVYAGPYDPTLAVARGDIRNKQSGGCIETPLYSNNADVRVSVCRFRGEMQYWLLMPGGQIRRNEACLSVSDQSSVELRPCREGEAAQRWTYRPDKTLYQESGHVCMTASGTGVMVAPCVGSDAQTWLLRITNNLT